MGWVRLFLGEGLGVRLRHSKEQFFLQQGTANATARNALSHSKELPTLQQGTPLPLLLRFSSDVSLQKEHTAGIFLAEGNFEANLHEEATREPFA